MANTYYMISEASKLVHVESHVLRYWEEELGLAVGRNELGHRVYSDEDIRLFNVIRILKEKGYQLKAIRELLPHLRSMDEEDVKGFQSIHFENMVDEEKAEEDTSAEKEGEENKAGDERLLDIQDERMERFEELLSDIVVRALEKYELSRPLQENVPVELSDKAINELVERIEDALDRRGDREEERLRLLDECIRNCQKMNQEQKKHGLVYFLKSIVT